MLLVIKTSSVKNPVFRKLLTPPQDDGEAETPIDYNVLLYAILMLLLEGDALRIVQRYSDCEDGVAAFLALQQVIKRDESGLHLSRIKQENY